MSIKFHYTKPPNLSHYQYDKIILNHIISMAMKNELTFFCDPFKSCQKGGVENMNKSIRQCLLRNIDLKTISKKQIYLVQERVSNRPGKKLKYLTVPS